MRPTLEDIRVVLKCIGEEDLLPVVEHLSGGSPEYRSQTGRFGLLSAPKAVEREMSLTAKKWKQQLAIGALMINEMGLEKYLSPLSDRDKEFIDNYRRTISSKGNSR
jgi:hypothetical protein